MKALCNVIVAVIVLVALIFLLVVLNGEVSAYEPELACTVVEDRQPMKGQQTWALACSANSGWAVVADEASPVAKWMSGRRQVWLRLKGQGGGR